MSEKLDKVASESSESQPAMRKQRVGIVRSTGMNKTIVVEYVARVPHPRFKKIVKRSKKFYAHDEKEEAAVGDKVRIEECRPLSKKKCWKLVDILSH
jgi:small subunit ribosomal protein S17